MNAGQEFSSPFDPLLQCPICRAIGMNELDTEESPSWIICECGHAIKEVVQRK